MWQSILYIRLKINNLEIKSSIQRQIPTNRYRWQLTSSFKSSIPSSLKMFHEYILAAVEDSMDKW